MEATENETGQRKYYSSGQPFRSKKCNFDRFIPYRPNLDINTSHTKLLSPVKHSQKEPGQYKDKQKVYYNKLLSGAFDSEEPRILPTIQRNDSGYSSPTTPLHSPFFDSTMDKVFGSPECKEDRRRVVTSPSCIMDMPCLRNDFYTNVLDWGSTNQIAVALQHITYIWNADTKRCIQIEVKSGDVDNYYVSSLSWNPGGKLVGIADNSGEVMICDPEQAKIIQQTPLKCNAPIGVMRWTQNGIFCGNRNGSIVLLDPRTPNMVVAEFLGHKREVCGLEIADGTNYMASGGDEGIVYIWELRTIKCYREINAHSACSKLCLGVHGEKASSLQVVDRVMGISNCGMCIREKKWRKYTRNHRFAVCCGQKTIGS
ncbi:Hypothetical predicted protein [Mytilus galloprovincialis]|uniref:Anaphase-promoting complex subunit 4-like WD40 domain-containing protein n=1 Tax=Mytilus galloprovincialis TaxID=29158 RepID=A0A8B6CHF1_MYTGA|nr:Hypothetical predicted protein [Mytilus galloprovincialis]